MKTICHNNQIKSNVYKLSASSVSLDDERVTKVPGEENDTFIFNETTVQEHLPNISTKNKDMRKMTKIHQEMRENRSYPKQASEYLTMFQACYICKFKSSVSNSRTAELWLMFMDITQSYECSLVLRR